MARESRPYGCLQRPAAPRERATDHDPSWRVEAGSRDAYAPRIVGTNTGA